MLINWNKDLEICPLVDEQHKRLVGLVNQLRQSYDQNIKAEDILNILYELKRYTEYHFKTEELMFEITGNKEKYLYHINEHRLFIAKVGEFAFKYFYNPQILTDEILNFLTSWVQHHIKVIDVRYKDLCNSLTPEQIEYIKQKVAKYNHNPAS